MKKSILLTVCLLLVALLPAVTMSYDGWLRVRGAVYNNWWEHNRGKVDNRLELGFNANLDPNLNLRARLLMGDVTWGAGGGLIPSNVNISAYELYADYRFQSCETNLRIGQQYWHDPMSLILDDSFSGIMAYKDDLAGFKTEFGWVKDWEGGFMDNDDNYFLANLKSKGAVPWGLYAAYGQFGSGNDDSFTFMPYINYDQNQVKIDASAFVGLHFNSPEDDAVGMGAAVKTKVGLGKLKVGGDLLFATENGISTLSPYYQNGLYIYGVNIVNDGLSMYWGNPYDGNNKSFLSLVGKVEAPLCEKSKAFGAAGYLLDEGVEINAGIEHQAIPNLMYVTGFGAIGINENDTTNFALGTTLSIPFK